MRTEYAVEMSNVRKEFGETVALDDVSFRVPRGTVYGFLGPNGAGKTTTMRILTTLTKPTAGSATVAGRPVEESESVLPEIGYLPDTPPVYEELTGREQLRHIARLRDVPAKRASERIESLSDRFDLESALDQRIVDYSTGMRQKLGLVQTLLHEPSVVFLDEPTSGLDPRATRRVRETVAELAADDVTVFFSSHVLSIVEALADQVGVLFEGRLVDEGTPSELVDRVDDAGNETLEDAFFAVTDDRQAAGGVP